MKHLKSLSDSDLLSQTQLLVAREREVTTELLWHLREVEARRLYAGQGYSSLFDYVRRGLGYCEGSADRRISAMRLLKDLPEIEPALKPENSAYRMQARFSTSSKVRRKIVGKTIPMSQRKNSWRRSPANHAETAIAFWPNLRPKHPDQNRPGRFRPPKPKFASRLKRHSSLKLRN